MDVKKVFDIILIASISRCKITTFMGYRQHVPLKTSISVVIYADQEAYQSHIQTAHFKEYKEETAKMVKSLKLIDVNSLAGMVR